MCHISEWLIGMGIPNSLYKIIIFMYEFNSMQRLQSQRSYDVGNSSDAANSYDVNNSYDFGTAAF